MRLFKYIISVLFSAILLFSATNSFAIDKSTTFTNEIFQKAQSEGKTVVINSWNKFCFTCSKQTKVLDQVEKEFKDVLFLSFEQTKNKDIAQFLKIDYWTTIVIYKDNKETYRSMGVTNKSEIYSAIKSNT